MKRDRQTLRTDSFESLCSMFQGQWLQSEWSFIVHVLKEVNIPCWWLSKGEEQNLRCHCLIPIFVLVVVVVVFPLPEQWMSELLIHQEGLFKEFHGHLDDDRVGRQLNDQVLNLLHVMLRGGISSRSYLEHFITHVCSHSSNAWSKPALDVISMIRFQCNSLSIPVRNISVRPDRSSDVDVKSRKLCQHLLQELAFVSRSNSHFPFQCWCSIQWLLHSLEALFPLSAPRFRVLAALGAGTVPRLRKSPPPVVAAMFSIRWS